MSLRQTRSSAIADGPRDATCQTNSCQLLLNSTTSPKQIEVMELEGYSQPTYNKLCASSHDALDRRRCNPQADRRRVQIKPVLRRLSVAEFSKSTI